MDTMLIRDLKLRCIIGTRPQERKRKQVVLVNLALECDLRKAGESDALEDTVNYSALYKRVVAMCERSRFLLIERLAREVARICLEDAKVAAVTVTIDKPGALEKARSAAVTIRRCRKG